MDKARALAAFALIAVTLAVVDTAQAQTVLKEQATDNAITLYVDDGPLPGPDTQNNNRIVRIQHWACPEGTIRPADGAVVFFGPPSSGSYRPGPPWAPRNIVLGARDCLLRTYDDLGQETDQIVTMIRMPDDGSYYITAGRQGDQIDSSTSTHSTNAVAAAAVGAAAAGYYNKCSSTAFELLSAPVPNPKKNPAKYACFMGYKAHAGGN